MSAAEFHFCASETPLFDEVGSEYARHLGTLRGLIRSEVTRANLSTYLAGIESAADVGSGTGGDSLWLGSQGIDVTMVEPSEAMRHTALDNLAKESSVVQERVRLVDGDESDALRECGDEAFDLVVSHGVLMYQEDPRGFIQRLGRLCKVGGVLSVLTKNAGSLAFRPALNGEYASALGLMNTDRSPGTLGVETQAHSLQQLTEWLFNAGFLLEGWYGVRVFTDHLADVAPETESIGDVLRLETEASRRDPYRSAARLLHVVGRRAR